MSYLTTISTRDLLSLARLGKTYRDNANSRHKLVMSLFPKEIGTESRSTNSILFRFERGANHSQCIIRSDVAPANLPMLRTIEESLVLVEGNNVRFRLVLNPIKQLASGKEMFIMKEDEQEEFAINRLSAALDDVEIIAQQSETIKRNLAGKSRITLVQFDGVAKISDSKKLNDFLKNGIGRSKSYGAGLLNVKQI